MTGNGTACPGHIDILEFHFFLYRPSYQLNIFLVDAGMSDKDLIPADLPIFLKLIFYLFYSHIEQKAIADEWGRRV